MTRRTGSILGALSVLLGGLAFSHAAEAATGTISPRSSSVAVGATFSADATGCAAVEEESDEGFSYQEPQLVLVTGTGAGERMAAFGQQVDETRHRFQVPGWVDPAQPAVIAGRCVLTEYGFDEETGVTFTTTTVFTYDDVAIDITPGTAAPSGPIVSVDRSTAAGGQVITVSGSGCQGTDYAEAVLYAGTDLSGRTLGTFVAGGGSNVVADGTFRIEVALNGRGETGLTSEGGPLPEGGYTLLSACAVESDEEVGTFFLGELQALTVAGTNPSGDFTATVSGDTISAMGSGCTGGQTVTVTFSGSSYDDGFGEESRREAKALGRHSLPDLAQLVADEDGEIHETLTVTPEPDGTWMVTTDSPADMFDLIATADCGDPTTTGFRYVPRYVFESNVADLYIQRESPTSSPAGGTVSLTVGGYCEDGEVGAAIVSRDREVLSQSSPFELNSYGFGTGTLTAPTTPGTYGVVGTCGDQQSYPEPYEVFAPETVSAEAPLPAEPVEGWPSQGPRETYHGKIGPIALPAMDMEDMVQGTKALGPSGLFIPVPRPEGDFAITKLSFDLVDDEGMPIGQDQAHLHHFVITNKSKENPACPDSTFGLPGQIVGAAGAERTVLQTSDPYGVVVDEQDDWTGVYELMSRSMEDQEVFLSYDIDYRRDVENVRPVTTYFGSATGCSSFTWDIDGSGTPDHQSHFVTITKPGRLIGAGGHIHNGAMHADWTNDRGRRLCRSEITYGDEAVGHGGHEMSRRSYDAAGEVTATTSVGEPIPGEDEYPPEFYDDDKVIEGISNCPLAESVSAGERLQFEAVYENERSRSGVMGIYTAYVWEGGGPAEPGPGGAEPIPGNPDYTG